MADSVFGFGPMGVLPEQPVKPEDKRRTIEGIASQSQVPANVLMALDEAGIKDTATAAQKIAADMKAGKSVDQIVGPDVMNRAYDIADELYPRKPAAPPQSGGNLAKDLAVEASGGAAQGVILGARGAGELATAAANSLINGPVSAAVRGATGRDLHVDLQNPLTAPTDAASNWVQGKIDANLTPETKQAIADSQITGDPLHPSTIDFGKDPSLRGIAAQGANVVGNLLPAFIMAVATGGATVPNAAAGMAMAAGDQAQSSDQFIDGLAAEKMPDGRSRLEAASPVYRNYIADGMSPSDALAATKNAASQLASIMSAPIGAIGGAIEGKLFNPAEQILEKSGWAARTLGRGAMGAATEGPQEMAEVVAGRVGTDAGAGTQQDLTQNTAGDLILGALGGHIGGTAAGAFSQREQEQNTGSDGSAPGQDTAPAPGLPGSAPGAVSAIEPAAAPPSGPIGRVSAIAPDLTPVPEAPPPAPFFPDQKPGSAIRLYDPEADKIHESVFLGETPEGVDVRIDGEAITLSPQEFDQARDEANRRDEEIKAASKAGKKKPTAVQPSEKPAPPVDPAIDDAAAEVLREAGYYDGPWNDVPPQDGSLSQQAVAAVKPPKPAKRAPDALTPEQALAQAKQIEETAKRGGWNKRLTTKHADLMAIANTGEKSDPVLDDGTQSAEPAAGNEPRDPGAVAGGKPDSGQPRSGDAEQGSPVGGNLQGDLVGATETGKPSGSLTANQKPRAPVTPMTADPSARIQPDLLGGQPVTETDMAAKERRRREWGQFLPIAESTKSPWDGELEGRTVIVRPGKVTIRAKADGKSDQDRVIDTAGMGRDEIAAAARGALRELDRIAPISPPAPGPVAPGEIADVPKKEQGAAVQALRDAVKLRDAAHDAYDADPTPENLKKTAQGANGPVSRAMKDLVDAVGNDKAQDIFAGIDAESEAARRKAPATPVSAAPSGPRVLVNKIGADGLTDAERAAGKPSYADPTEKPEPAKAAIPTVENIREKAAVLRGIPKDAPPTVDGISLKWDDKEGGFIFARKHVDKVMAAVGIGAEPTQEPAKVEEARPPQAVPTAAEVKAAAAQADPSPTEAQKEAGNYQMGHISWNGLDLTIETAKGQKRTGTDSDGEAWSVTMPANYGYIKGTVGADGDHLDIYMGTDPKSELVIIVDQVDSETGRFDEHKVMIGFRTEEDAKAAYIAGFSDGKGPARMGGVSVWTLTHFVEQAKNPDQWKGPVGRIPNAKVKPVQEAKPATYGASNTLVSADRAAELRAKLKDKLRNQLNAGIDPEILAIGAELAVFHIEAGARKFAALAKAIADDLGTTPAKIRPYLRSWYNGARDMMEDSGLSIEGMDDAAAVKDGLAKLDAAPSPEPEKTATVDAQPTDGAGNEPAISASTGQVGEGGKPEADGGRRGSGQPARQEPSGSVAGAKAGSDQGDDGMGGAGAAGPRSGGSDRTGDNPLPEGGDGPRGSKANGVDGLGNARPERKRPEGAGRSNYHITDPESLFAGGPKARFAKNRAAMEAFQRITDENRQPTPEELDAMASFTGWGSFGQELFQGSWGYNRAKPEWKSEDAWLREHLGQEALESAQNSIINAHYTDPPTVKAIWDAVRAMGFDGGRVLEPAMGVGNFFGMMPRELEANSALTGIELEQTTGSIAKMLYPRANVRIMGYEKSQVPDGFYDLVIGNWPFANVTMADRRYDRLAPSLHDYFFVKGLDQVRPGGLVVGITSAFTMDGQKNQGVRHHLAKNAELVASFRLPSGAFEKYAGTKVVTDLIILRKRETPILSTTEESWVRSVPFETPSGETIHLNQYYVENPGRILGMIDTGHGTTYGKAGMIVHRPSDIAERLTAIASQVPADAFKPVTRGTEPRFVANTTTDRRFSISIGKDGALYHVQGDQMAPLEDVAKFKTTNQAETENRIASIKSLVELRQAAEATLEADQAGAEDADKKRATLKKLYQAFVKAHGKVADSFALRIMEKVSDPNAGLVAALETRGGEPSPLMERATVRAARKLDNPTIRDAFVMTRNESVKLNLDRIAELAKKTLDDVSAELLGAKAIYRVPGGGYEASDSYLSGNVRQKLREAKDALALGEDMQASVDALTEVIPADIPYFQIEARFGADWLNPDHNRQFIIDTLGLSDASDKDISLTRAVTGWKVEVSDKVARMNGVLDITGAPLPGRNGTGLSLRRFLEATLNTQTLTVTYSDEDGSHKDTKATEQANQKAADLRQKFGEWVWGDPERRIEVERDYNEAMNAVATPKVDGSFLEFPGMALKRGDQPFNLRQHQSNAIWKGILNQRGIYGHEVGTGKTITMTGIAVESRRYGLARKPLLIAHNANSAAVAAEAQETYPGAKILYVNNLAPSEINAQLARMATEDWDLIVIPHSLLDRMALTYETLMDMAAEDIAAYEREAIQAAEDDPNGANLTLEDMDNPEKLKKMRLGVTAKEMVKARNRLIQNIEKQSQRASKEGAVSFEKLGIDMILVDESHEFKKPPLATRMQVKGLNVGTSNKSLALRFLTSYVKAQRGGTGVHVFTGTPITNTLSEIYHQMYYAMDDVMRQNSVDTWDGFFKTFADTIADVELTSTGDFENVERLAAFINVSELRRMAGQFMDIVFAKDMPEFLPRSTPSGKIITDPGLTASERDFLENGRTENPIGRPYKKVIHDLGPMGRDQKRILDEVIYYANVFKAAKGKERMAIMRGGGPDAPIVYNNVPNRASMDARLQEVGAEDHPQSKANRAVRNTARIYLEEPMATQVLFMDEGYSDETTSVRTDADGNKTKTKKKKFNLANDIVAKLIAAGVKREEIAIVAGGVSAEQKKAIADAMNARKIRVVIGQTKTLGVGVNMQKYLRAMHHLDAPWMPGDLEQRNGRGERQGNTWNTVMEYRYLTEGLDGRRWQVLAIKDRFIKAFLQAKDGVRVIEGDATDDAESVDGSALADTLSQASGDPRLMLISKLKKNIDRLQNRERIHTTGIADAIRKLRRLKEDIAESKAEMPPLRDDAKHVESIREAGTFTAVLDGKTFTERPEATEAINAYVAEQGARLARGSEKVLPLEVQGFGIKISKTQYAFKSDDFTVEVMRRTSRRALQQSLASIEATIRSMPTRLENNLQNLAEMESQVVRLEKAKDEPFQQAGELARKKAQQAAIEDDLQANPVPPPSWLRVGAPVDSLAYVDGKERVVTGHRWTKDAWLVSTEDGDVDYRAAKDVNGVSLYDERPFEAPVINEGSKMKNGDEDAKASESRFENAQPVASLTGNELGEWEDIRQLGKKAEAWYRDNLVGQTAVNAETGWSIQFTNRGAKKIGSRKGDDLFRMVPALREIVESGRVVASEPDSKGRPEIKTIHKIAARVMLDGVEKDVVATIRETNEGSFHYDLGRDKSDGARYFRFDNGYAAVRMSETQVRSPALEGDSVELNIDFAAPEINAAAIPVEALRAINTALAREIKASGLEGKVTPILVKSLLGRSGIPVQGRQSGAVVEVSELAADKVGVLRHEIVHALRDARLWERPFGLFTEQEWRALAQAARGDAGLMARVATVYPDLSKEGQIEEAIAEVYREWAAARDGAGLVAHALNKIAAFFRAFASALRGQGFTDAAMVMERIAGGKIGGRGPGGGVASQETSAERAPQSDAEMRPGLLKAQTKFKGIVGSRHWKNPGEFVSNLVTDAMAGKGDYSALALVPGRALFSELGKRFISAKTYLRHKEEMDALRNDWHARADKVAQEWLKMRNANPDANDAFMDLMHRSTLSGIDPSKEDEWKHAMGKAAENAISRDGDDAPLWAHDVMQQIADHKYAYSALRAPFEALPSEFQALYGKVRAQYDRLGDDFESAVLRNIANATKIGLKRAERAHRKEMERIRDEGLEGEERDEAKAKADAALKAVKMRGGFSAKARIAALRKKFESNKLKGPYFPLARFGDYFVTVRNQEGAVVSFSRFERESQQQTFIRELKESGETRYEFGTLDSSKKLRAQIDPSFVADIENMLAESGAGDEVMDAVWQRWLETLPDQSIRTAKIHRKGRRGYSNDAFRAFGKHMFHGAHQLARLEYGLPMEEALNEAEEEARVSDNPNRAGLLVAEMRKRHDFTMNPSGSSIVASMSGAAFIWYLGASPAAALANITQTTVVGIPLMSARFAKAGVTGTTKALGRAAKDFMAGKGQAENAPDLAPDERAALLEAVRRGTIDKTQAHDLASVAETGIEYNASREKWMRRIGWFFHQAERFNREVTFLAGYRLAKAEGLNAADAIDAAADITWKVHFDYQNTSRPRFMQNDLGKILTTFRQFTVNLIWRMFRDTHQALHGATKEERREARLQLVGVTLSMMAHAGIRGTWGYGLLMMLLGMLTPGADDDDIKEWLQDALVMEGDSPGVAAWNYAMGAALNGIPGQVLGVDLTERIGMPNLWFREADNDLEGEDLYAHYVMELLGPAFGIGAGFFRGAQMAADGEWWRGTEAAVPKMVRDVMKTARYVDEGVQTVRGDTILDGVNPYQALMQLGGFTPAKIAERYDINSRLKDRERQITDERRDIQREAGDAALAGQDLPESVLAKIRDFNLRYPEYPITGDTIRQSARGRMQAQLKSEFGIVLNSKLNDRLRGERAPSIYN